MILSWQQTGDWSSATITDYADVYSERFLTVYRPEILNYYKENHVAPIREFNPMKDNTDTDIAFQQAIVLGSSEITILGATGGRLDHFLSIVQNLKTAWEKKIPATSWTAAIDYDSSGNFV